MGSIPRPGRSPGEGNGNPLQYSCLGNLMDRGAWWARGHGVAKRQVWLNNKWPTEQFATTALKSSQFSGMYIQLGSLSTTAGLREEFTQATSHPQLQLCPNPHNCCNNSFFMALRPMSPILTDCQGEGVPTPLTTQLLHLQAWHMGPTHTLHLWLPLLQSARENFS